MNPTPSIDPRVKGALALLLVLGLAACDTQTQSEEAHVHGVVRLTIAIDSPTSASLELTSPAMSIYGFEHDATTAEDISARDASLEVLETRMLDLLGLPEDLGCTMEEAVVEVVLGGDDDDHGDDEQAAGEGRGEALSADHAEVRGLYRIACAESLEGERAEITLGNVFGGIETLNVTVLTAAGQRAEILERGIGAVDL